MQELPLRICVASAVDTALVVHEFWPRRKRRLRERLEEIHTDEPEAPGVSEVVFF